MELDLAPFCFFFLVLGEMAYTDQQNSHDNFIAVFVVLKKSVGGSRQANLFQTEYQASGLNGLRFPRYSNRQKQEVGFQ
jgi:hypothetical protein